MNPRVKYALIIAGIATPLVLLGMRRTAYAAPARYLPAGGNTFPSWMGGGSVPTFPGEPVVSDSAGNTFPSWMGGGAVPQIPEEYAYHPEPAADAADAGGSNFPSWMGGFATPDFTIPADPGAGGEGYHIPEEYLTGTVYQDSWAQADAAPAPEPAPTVVGAPTGGGSTFTMPDWAGGGTWDLPQVPSGGSPAPYDPRGDSTLQWYQWALSLLGYDPGPVDGRMGTQTRHALSKFQSAHGIRSTGTLDQATMTAINTALNQQQPAVNPASDW